LESKIYVKIPIGEVEAGKQQLAVGKFVEGVKENDSKSSGKFLQKVLTRLHKVPHSPPKSSGQLLARTGLEKSKVPDA
jgi:hypothetical protein